MYLVQSHLALGRIASMTKKVVPERYQILRDQPGRTADAPMHLAFILPGGTDVDWVATIALEIDIKLGLDEWPGSFWPCHVNVSAEGILANLQKECDLGSAAKISPEGDIITVPNLVVCDNSSAHTANDSTSQNQISEGDVFATEKLSGNSTLGESSAHGTCADGPSTNELARLPGLSKNAQRVVATYDTLKARTTPVAFQIVDTGDVLKGYKALAAYLRLKDGKDADLWKAFKTKSVASFPSNGSQITVTVKKLNTAAYVQAMREKRWQLRDRIPTVAYGLGCLTGKCKGLRVCVIYTGRRETELTFKKPETTKTLRKR
jgi:hypothetical protein